MEEICKVITDGDHQAPPKSKNGIPFLVISDVISGRISFHNCRFVPEDYYNNLDGNRRAEYGDILFTVTGSYGKPILVDTFKPFCFQRHIGLIKPLIHNDYLMAVLSSDYILKECNKTATGTAQKTVGLESIRNFFIPIPSQKEQEKICKEIAIYNEIIDEITANKEILTCAISLCKSKILDLAMQGKLVEQDPSDESASDMLRRINPKAKIITDNPHSWNIPSCWCWVEVKSVFHPMQRRIPEGENFYYIDIDSVNNNAHTITPKYLKVKDAPSRATRETRKNDIVFSMVRPYLRNIAQVSVDECIASTGFYIFRPSEAIDPKFALILVLSDFFVDGINQFMKGDNSPSVNKDNVDSFIIPLPPIKEQKRIVNCISIFNKSIKEIEASLQS